LREIAWLQVSDIHMRQRDEWSQDVVLRATADSIRQRRRQGLALDFILATGDLAFSGKREEYELVKHFFDELVSASGVPKERIFCIPGNHDVNRDRQKLCFQGARSALTSPNAVDPVLAPDSDDLATLVQRQEAYRAFQTSYFEGQNRIVTPDGLGYASSLSVEDVVIAIVGLNSAWLSEGGTGDHGHLLIGERQVINAFDAAENLNAHIVIGMAHHPLHLLRDFDRNAVMRRIEERCHFYHCGHLHQPEAHGAGFDASACLSVAAGASFETRESRNAYSLLRLDLLAGTRTLTTVQYDPVQSSFAFANDESFPIRLIPKATCQVNELAEAIAAFEATLAPHSYYLAALLTEQKTEIPIPGRDGYVFGAVAVLLRMPDGDYRRKVEAFLRFGSVLTIFYGRHALAELFARHGQAVRVYGAELLAHGHADPLLESRIAQQETDVRRLLATQPQVSFAADWFADLVQSEEWELLTEQARRHLDNQDEGTNAQARRMLALALAHSADDSDKSEAVREYEILIQGGLANVQDRGNLALLLTDLERIDEAKAIVLEAIAVGPLEALEQLALIGQQVVVRAGDREFRKQLASAIAQRQP